MSLLEVFITSSYCFSCRNHFRKNGFGNPIVPEAGLFCAALHRQCKEFCRARIESVTSSGMVRALYYKIHVYSPRGVLRYISDGDVRMRRVSLFVNPK